MNNKLILLFLLSAIFAFAQSGEIDTSFGINGKVITGIGSNNNWAYGIAIQPDGKFIVGGTYVSSNGDNDFALSRYNIDGSLDITFGTGGRVVTDFLDYGNNYSYIHSVLVLPNGKIIVFGTTGRQGFTPQSAVVRYAGNGSIDTGFGNNGKIVSNLFPYSINGSKMAVQPDGKLIITSEKIYDADPNYYIGVERYTEDGVLDTSFGTNGVAVAGFGNGRSIASSIVLQPDGKIVVSATYNQSAIFNMSITRFNGNGTLDTSFDSDGKVTTSFGPGTSGESMQAFLKPDGKIIIAGAVYNTNARYFGVVQYNNNGSLDTTFDSDGKAWYAFAGETDYSSISSVTRQADGKFLVICKPTDYGATTSDFVVRRYNANVTIDTDFGVNGRIQTSLINGYSEAQSAAVAPNGEIFVAGKILYGQFNNTSEFAIAKYSSNGNLEPALDGDGKLTTTFEKDNDRIKKILVLPDDKFIAVGTSAYRQANNARITNIALSKYNSDGTPDTAFGNSGKILSNFDNHRNSVITAALQADGKIVVINVYWITENVYEIIRYNADGSLDTQFGNNGKIVLPFMATAIVCQPDGKLVVAGDVSNNIIVIRYNSNGTPDTGFGSSGTALITLATFHLGSVSMALQPDGKILISDTTLMASIDTPTTFGIARINQDGSLDTAFGNNGKVTTIINDGCYPYATFVQPDGKIIVAGKSVAGGSYFSSVRYLTNGDVDITYGNNGITSYFLSTDYREVNAIHLQSDSKLLAVLTKYNQPLESYNFKIMRYNPDNTHDGEFGGSEGIEMSFYSGYDEAFAIGLQSDSKIIVAGATYNGINEDFALVRYTNSVPLHVNRYESNPAGFIIYPNPVKDVLKLSPINGTEILNYTIYNMMGQVVKSSHKGLEVDTSYFSNGIYNIVVTTGKGTESRKFIKE
jgi:uncharacterized delta-60 repeat protein